MTGNGAVGAFAVGAGGRWKYAGALTMGNAARVLAAAQAVPLPDSGIVDFSGLAQADSAALALAIALKRRAAAEGRPIEFASIPPALMTLAVAYGVEELIAA